MFVELRFCYSVHKLFALHFLLLKVNCHDHAEALIRACGARAHSDDTKSVASNEGMEAESSSGSGSRAHSRGSGTAPERRSGGRAHSLSLFNIFSIVF